MPVLTVLQHLWDRVTGTQPAPPDWVVAVSGVVALLVVLNGWFWHLTRNAITIAHEGGHALVSLLAGRRLQGIRLHSDTSGETRSRGRPDGPGLVLTTLAGYLTPPLLGAGAAGLLAGHHVVLLLWLLLALLGAMLLAIRNAYGALAVLVTAAAVVAVSWLATALVQAAFGYAAAWFLLLGGVRPVVELQRSRARARRYRRRAAQPGRVMWQGRAPESDADQLAGLTGVPGGVWVGLFLLIAFAALAVGAWLLVPVPLPVPRLR
jgi:Peptidase M50B-like